MEKLNCSGMLIDIYDPDLFRSEIVVEVYKDAGNEFGRKIHREDEPFLIYVALMYDRASPLKRYTIESKKTHAVRHAGFTDPELVKRAFTLRKTIKGESVPDNRLVGLIHFYLKYQNDFAWSSYIMNAELFYQNQQTVLKGASDSKEQETIMKLMDRNEQLRSRLKSYEDEIFGDNKDLMAEIIKFSVEDFVEKLEEE